LQPGKVAVPASADGQTRGQAELVEPQFPGKKLPRDVNDIPALGTFLAAKADSLVTSDNDLLALTDRYPIVSPADFWHRHGG
jgi:predicted nucleic acid-binding protein